MAISVIKYTPEYRKKGDANIADFDCRNSEINSLFRKKLDTLPTTTYFFIDKSAGDKIIAFVSFCASSIQMKQKGK